MSMKKPNLGFISLSLTGYIMLGLGMIVLVLSIALKVQTSRLDSVKSEYAQFVATVKSAGDAAKVKAEAENKLNLERKVKSDEELRNLRIANDNLNKRVRERSAGSVLPQTETAAGEPSLACFDRGILDQSLRAFTGGTAEIAISGQQATEELNNAKRWANP